MSRSIDHLETTIDAIGYTHNASVTGYGIMLGTVFNGIQIIAKKLLQLVDVRRLIIVAIVGVGLSLVAYLVAMELGYQKALGESRCYKNKLLYSTNNQATAIVSKNGTNLMAISYDTFSRLSRTSCMCPGGNVLNAFNFMRFDFKSKRIYDDTTNCMCDSDYIVVPGSIVFNGDKKLVQFMSTGDRNDAAALFGTVVASADPAVTASASSSSYNKAVASSTTTTTLTPSSTGGLGVGVINPLVNSVGVPV